MAESTNDKKANLKGTRGWLALLILMMLLYPVISGIYLFIQLIRTEVPSDLDPLLDPHVFLIAIYSFSWFLWGILSAFTFAAGISLWQFRTAKAVRVAITMTLIPVFFTTILLAVIAFFGDATTLWDEIKKVSVGIILDESFTVISIWYLLKSRRVRNTYYAQEAIHTSPLQDAKQS